MHKALGTRYHMQIETDISVVVIFTTHWCCHLKRLLSPCTNPSRPTERATSGEEQLWGFHKSRAYASFGGGNMSREQWCDVSPNSRCSSHITCECCSRPHYSHRDASERFARWLQHGYKEKENAGRGRHTSDVSGHLSLFWHWQSAAKWQHILLR